LEDFAVLALRADTSGLKPGEAALNSLASTAERTEARTGTAMAATGAAAAKTGAAMNAAAVSSQRAMAQTAAFASAAGAAAVPTRNMGFIAQQAAYQVGDMAVQIGAGTAAARAMGMQLPQLLGAFGPVGAVIGTVVAVAFALGAAFVNAGDGANTLSNELGDVVGSASAVEGAISAVAAVAETYVDTINRQGGASSAAAQAVIANSAAEFAARKEVLAVEIELLRIRGAERKADMAILQSHVAVATDAAMADIGLTNAMRDQSRATWGVSNAAAAAVTGLSNLQAGFMSVQAASDTSLTSADVITEVITEKQKDLLTLRRLHAEGTLDALTLAKAEAVFANDFRDLGTAANTALGGIASGSRRAAGGLSEAEKQAAKLVEQLQGPAVAAVEGMAGAFGDFIAGGLSDFKNFGQSILSEFRRMLSQMISMSIANPIRIALGLTAGMSPAELAAGGGGAGGGGLLSGVSGVFGSIGEGLKSVWGGLTSGGLGGAMSAITEALGGVAGGGLAGLGAAIGALAGPVGLVIGLLSAFRTKTRLLDAGLMVTVNGLDVAVQKFSRIEKSRLFGLIKSTSSNYGTADAEIADPIRAAVGDMQTSIRDAADILGFASSTFDAFAFKVKISTKGMSKDEALQALQDRLLEVGDAYAGMIPGLAALQAEGEGASDALTRLSSALAAVNLMTDTLGLRFTAVGLVGADMASQLADAFGGLDALNSATAAYYQTFYTQAERNATATRQAAAALAELGGAMPLTRDEYRAMVEAQDLTTQAGRELFAALVGLAGVMDQVLPTISNITAEIASLVGLAQTGIDAMISATESAQSEANSAAKAWYATAKSLRDFIADLRGTASVLISPQRALANNQARFQMLLARAISGDRGAADDLVGAANNLLDSSRSTARTAFEAAKAQAMVMSDMQLAAGASDISGAAQDATAGLLRQQNAILRQVRDYLAGGGVLNPNDLDALNGQLGALQAAIEAARNTTYASLRARIDMTVDLIANANIPRPLRTMLANAADGITADLDFIVRAEGITPDVRFLALNNTSEHLTTVEFLARHPRVPRDVFRLALDTTGEVARTVNFVLGSRLTPDQMRLAIGVSSEITRTVNAVIPESRRDSRGVRLALATTGDLNAIVRTVSGRLANGAATADAFALAMTASSDLTRTIGAAFAPGIDRQARALALATASDLTRMVDAVIPEGRRDSRGVLLALATSSALARSVTATLDSGGSADAIRLALAETRGLTRTVVASIGGASEDRALRVALATSTALTRTIAAVQDATSDPRAMNLALATGGALIRNVRAAMADGSPRALELALAQNTALVRSIRARLDDDSSNDAEAIALNGNSLLVRTIRAAMGESNARALALALGEDRGMVRRIMAQLADGANPNAVAVALGVDAALVRTVQVAMGAANGNALAVALSMGGALTRNVNAVTGNISADALALATASSGALTRTVNGRVDLSRLTDRQLAFLNALTGSTAGQITLGGSFVFDPSGGFQAWFENATAAGIADPVTALIAPMANLRATLYTLAQAIRANTHAIVNPPPVDPGTGGGGDNGNAAALAAAQADGIAILGMRDDARLAYQRDLFRGGASGASNRYYQALVQRNRELEAARQAVSALGGVPAFAAGGLHGGGLRVVGENGPEIEATGPARYYSAPQTRGMLGRDDGALLAELQAMRKELADLREQQRQLGISTATNSRKTADVLRKWDNDGLPVERI
jgi:hypothetical protein